MHYNKNELLRFLDEFIEVTDGAMTKYLTRDKSFPDIGTIDPSLVTRL